MTVVDNDGFAAWNQAYPPPQHAGEMTTLQPGSVFLQEDVVLHGSGIAPSGWNWFDSPRHLAEYLLYAGLPDLAGWWFDGHVFGGPAVRMPLRDTVEWATAASPGDKAFFLSLADDLDAIVASSGPVDFDSVAAVAERFTDRFGDTPAGRVTLSAYPNTISAGTALLEAVEEVQRPDGAGYFEDSEWLDLCARSGTDSDASEVVARVFADAHSV